MSNIKTNINHLHYLLSENFKDINIEEKSDKKLGNHFIINIKENLTCKIIIQKSKLESSNLEWSYYANPNDENSIVERSSTIEEVSNIVTVSFGIDGSLPMKRFVPIERAIEL